MARLTVTHPELGSEAPFLRGILTRSLQESGLDFEQAYALSSEIRQSLLRRPPKDAEGERIELTSRELQAQIIKKLRREGLKDAAERYRSRKSSAVPVAVLHKGGEITPFSRAHHQVGLQSCGLPSEEAAGVTVAVYETLLARAERTVDSVELDVLTHECLGEQLGPAVARRYLVWRDFCLSGRPLLLLIGGAAGCGKSTIASALASRLEIVRTQSTDMLREVMRVVVPQRLLPVLHESTFDAWRALPRVESGVEPTEELVIDGFSAQSKLLSLACEAVIDRAIRERVSLVLEGVHVEPELINSLPDHGDALVMPLMLGVLNPNTLKARIRGRGRDASARRAARYLKGFDEIWRLQSHLLSEADRVGIPIVRNTDPDRVFLQVMRMILDRLSQDFARAPEDVFEQHRRSATA